MESQHRILVVDDNTELCANIQDILEASGYTVESAFNGKDAVDLCKKNGYDIALVDIKLPDIQGPEVVEKIVKLSPSTDIIYITGHASLEDAIEAVRQEHVASYETKPLDMDRLQAILKQILMRKRTEEALRASEEMYRTIAETIPDAITITDLEGRITYVSKQTLKMHRTERADDLLGRSAFEHIAPEDHEKAMMNLQRTMKEGIVRDVEYTLMRKDGTSFPGELNAAVIKDAFRKPTAFIAITRDITERKQVEEQTKQLQEYLQLQVVRMPIGLIVWDIEFRVTSWNPAAERILASQRKKRWGNIHTT